MERTCSDSKQVECSLGGGVGRICKNADNRKRITNFVKFSFFYFEILKIFLLKFEKWKDHKMRVALSCVNTAQ